MNEWNHSNDPRYQPGYPPGVAQDPRRYPGKKSKWIAGLLSFLFPGTGHFYLGQMAKGIAVMLLIAMDICAIVFAAQQLQNVMIIVLLSLLMPIIYFYSLFDAIQSTEGVNDRRYYSNSGQVPGPAPAAGWNAPYYGMPAGAPAPEPPNQAYVPASEEVPVPPGDRHSSHAPMDQMRFSEGMSHSQSQPQRSISGGGMILLAAGAVILLLAADFSWTHWLFHSSGSMVGSIVLISAGIGLWVWEMRNPHGRKG